MTPVQQVQAIVDRVFGAAPSPSDFAAREVLAAALTDVIGKTPAQLDYSDIINTVAVEYCFSQAVVEIQAQLVDGVLNEQQAVQREASARQLVTDAIARIPALNPSNGPLSPRDFQKSVAAVVKATIRALGGKP